MLLRTPRAERSRRRSAATRPALGASIDEQSAINRLILISEFRLPSGDYFAKSVRSDICILVALAVIK